MSITFREREFAFWLKHLIDRRDIRQAEVAELLHLSAPAISQRFHGYVPFNRKEVEILDDAWHENGALLERAGFLEPSRSHLLITPQSRYLDEAWIKERLDDAHALWTSPTPRSGERTERYLTALLRYLISCKEDRITRRYRTQVRLDLLELRGDVAGVDARIFQAAKDLRHAVEDAEDKSFAYDYTSTMTNLAIGVGQFEEALEYQREAFQLTPYLEDPEVENLRTTITIADLYSHIDPENAEAIHALQTASSALEVVSYPLGDWPRGSPSYLDVLLAKLNLQLSPENIASAGETVEFILHSFHPSPFISDNITTLVAVAEFYALDYQEALMEEYLRRAGNLMRQHDLNYYATEIERVRSLFEND